MTDESGSKTLTVLLGIVLVGTFLYVARLSRRDASGSEFMTSDATTHAGRAPGRDDLPDPPAEPSPGWDASVTTRWDPGVPNRALTEMEAIESALPAAPAHEEPPGPEARAPMVDMGPLNGS